MSKNLILAKDRKPNFVEGEVWKDLVGFEGIYFISSLGRIQVVRTGKLKFPVLNDKGYWKIHLSNYRQGTRMNLYVAWLVAKTFLGELPYGYHVIHKNGITSDIRAENLEYKPCLTS
jgi:hypothetical protein